MPIVEIEGTGQEIEFPDSMSPDEIKIALRKKFGSPSSVQQKKEEDIPRLQKIAESPAVQFTLGAGDEVNNLIRSLVNIGKDRVGYVKTGEGPAYETGKLAGDVGSFIASVPIGGSALTGAKLASKGIPYISKGLEALSGPGMLPKIARTSLGGAAFGAVEKPEDRLGNAVSLGALGGLAEGGIQGISKGWQALKGLKPTKYFRGSLPPEEIKERLRISQGTNTDLGNVINSPSLQRNYSNILSKIPGSGVYNKMLDTASQVKSKGKDLLQRILGDNNNEDVGKHINQALKEAKSEAVTKGKGLYTEAEDLADNDQLKIGRENFSKTAASILEEIKKSPELLREIKQSTLDDLKFYSNPGNINSLRLSNIFKGKLGDKSKELYISGNDYEAKIYNKLRGALKNDINESIDSRGSDELKSKYNAAEKFHAENVSPFEDPDLEKFIRKGADPDLIISHFVKKGSNDRGLLLGKLQQKLSTNKKGLLPYGYFSRSIEEGDLNPLKLKTLYKSLGENQRKALFHDQNLKKEMDDYVKLVEMNTEPLSVMFNPKTGQRNLDVLPYLIPHILSGIGAVGGYEEGGTPGGVLGGVAGLLSTSYGARKAANYLTSPKVREKFISKMINNDSKSTEEYASDLGKSLAISLKKKLGRNKEK